MFNVFFALLNPGDEVILSVPFWLSYLSQIKVCGAVPVLVKPNNLRLNVKDIEKNIANKTKLIVLNSPNNPEGTVYEKEELKKIAELVCEKDISVISDEVYEAYVYDNKEHISVASFGEDIKRRTILINAVSKTYSMTGWRIGYCACDARIARAINNFQSHTTSNPCSISQKAALEAFTREQVELEKFISIMQKRRDFMVHLLKKTKFSFQIPNGGFYVFLDISSSGFDSITFCEKLLEQKHVAIVPEIIFGDDKKVRISFANSEENIKEFSKRFQKFLN